MRDCTKFYIDGQWVAPEAANTVDVENPATEETIGQISFGTKADVDKAVAAARRAFESFSQTSREERLTLLRAIQAEIESRKEELATAVSDEMGAPMSLANGPHVGLLAAQPDRLQGLPGACDGQHHDPQAQRDCTLQRLHIR